MFSTGKLELLKSRIIGLPYVEENMRCVVC